MLRMQEADQLRAELAALRTTNNPTGTTKGPGRAPRRPSSAGPRLSSGAAPRGGKQRLDPYANPTTATSLKGSPSKKCASPRNEKTITCAAVGGIKMKDGPPRAISATIFNAGRCTPAASSAATDGEAAACAPTTDRAHKAVASGTGGSLGSASPRERWQIMADCRTGAACQALGHGPKGAGGRNRSLGHGFVSALGGGVFAAGMGKRFRPCWMSWNKRDAADAAAAPYSRTKLTESGTTNAAHIITILSAIAITFAVSAMSLSQCCCRKNGVFAGVHKTSCMQQPCMRRALVLCKMQLVRC